MKFFLLVRQAPFDFIQGGHYRGNFMGFNFFPRRRRGAKKNKKKLATTRLSSSKSEGTESLDCAQDENAERKEMTKDRWQRAEIEK